MSKYTTLDTLIVTNAGRTDSVRVSKTISDSNEHAIVWSWPDGRFVCFNLRDEVLNSINKPVSELTDTDYNELQLYTNN